jgi:hypothetical protein
MKTHTTPTEEEPMRTPECMREREVQTDNVSRAADADDRDTDEDGYGYGV